MADATLSGYKVTAQTVSFTGTQTLTSLADDEWTNLSDAIDNSTNKYIMVDLELVLGSASFPVATDNIVSFYLVPSVDGTNYPNWVGNIATEVQENNIHFIGSVTCSDATEAQRLVLRAVSLPPGLYKYGVRNRAGVAFASSGNTLKWRPWQFSSA